MDVERRLREALSASAALVDEPDLHRREMPWDERHDIAADSVVILIGGRRRRRSMLSVAAAIVATAGIGTSIVVLTQKDSATHTPTAAVPAHRPSVSPQPTQRAPTPAAPSVVAHLPRPFSSTAAPLPLVPGLELNAAEIPWKNVGAGWSLLIAATSPYGATTDVLQADLLLLAPNGVRYRVANLQADDRIVSWSPDLRRALLRRDVSGAMREISLIDGNVSRELSLDGTSIQYRRPSGDSLLATMSSNDSAAAGGADGDAGKLVQLSLGGRVEHRYAIAPRGVLQGGDGRFVVFTTDTAGGSSGGLVRLSDATVRPLAFPPDVTCDLVRWWKQDTIALAKCKAVSGAGSALWLVRVNGSAPSRLLSDAAGIETAYQLPTGELVQTEVDECGDIPLKKLGKSGPGASVPLADPDRGNRLYQLVGVGPDKATFYATSCDGSAPVTTVVSYDMTSSKTTQLYGGFPNDGAITQIIPSPGDE